MTIPRLLISAGHKSSGKTTLTLGLCAALRGAGETVQPFKKGPDYIDPLWLGEAAGRPCYNLDFYTMAHQEIRALFESKAQGATLALVEGNKGLHDGLDLDGSNSNAALATLLELPVVLVVDTQGTIRGVAPLLLGYQAFDPAVHIAGVIFNKVGGSRHESKLRQVVEHYTNIPILGAVHRSSEVSITERHLGLIPSNERQDAAAKISAIARLVSAQVELDQIRAIAQRAAALQSISPAEEHAIRRERLRLGVVRDRAFGFYYQDDLERLEQGGAELIWIDSLNDQQLPPIDALFIGGGFPEAVMPELSANTNLRAQIRAAIEAGLPCYAECGGLMYLARSIAWRGQRFDMVGAIPGDVVMHERPQGRGYIRLAPTAAFPWPSAVPADRNVEICGHEFHHSSIENLPASTRYAYVVKRGHGVDGKHDGIVYKNLLAAYGHQRAVGANHWTQRFLAFARANKAQANQTLHTLDTAQRA